VKASASEVLVAFSVGSAAKRRPQTSSGSRDVL
jgi:hypothetical protein